MAMIDWGSPGVTALPVRAAVLPWLALCMALSLVAGPSSAAGRGASAGGEAERALALVRQWVAGRYDNSAQAASDVADQGIPDDRKHRLMHQLFVPVPVAVPAIPGYLVFQQSSVDGSEDPELITRVGLLQFFSDEAGQLRQRELNFKDLDAFKNAHRSPDRLRGVTLADVRFDAGCDFPLRVTVPAEEVAGVMPRGTCRFHSQSLGKELIADDAVTIRAAEYWFLGRFVDDTGKVMWGNASDEPVKLRRIADPAAGR
jgi:hypothetical protein